ncbi:MAG: cyclopropane-fatty-acyl-phospholipid synthase family protein [Planctomycetota bacterium]
MKTAIRLVERGLVPKPLIRRAIRRLLRERQSELRDLYGADRSAGLASWVEAMRAGPVAPVPDKANEQHYEVPAGFFDLALGSRLKYSSAYYPDEHATLDEAEEAMLALTAERAQLADGQRILELGCGWGSLSLWMAERFPAARIVSVSNSGPQRERITGEACRRGLTNLEVVTCDMNAFDAADHGAPFDRIVSVEMFEHMRNWEELLGRASRWLAADGRVFLHVFAHTRWPYPFEVRDESDWMSKYFFTGGMMPCHDLLDHLTTPFEVEQRWEVNGSHYARTSEDWVRNLERRRAEVLPVLAATYGAENAGVWFQRWRIFFLACAELFAFDAGKEWIVSHQLLRPRATAGASGSDAR